MDVETGPTACARFKAGFESFGREEGGVANIFYDTLYAVLYAICPPLLGPADPPAQYFLERIRRSAVRTSTVAGLHRTLETIK
jgi:hypothetical protein